MDISASIPELLAACGLFPVGEPPAVTVDVLGRAVHMEFVADESQVDIAAKVASAAPPTRAQLDEASLAAAGDCWFSLESQQVVGRRTLVQPAAGELFAVIHEMGKQVVSLGGISAAPAPAPAPAPVPSPSPAAPATASPGPADSPWFFVDAPTPLRAAPTSEETVAMLMPGIWYQVVRHDGEWTWAEHPSGVQGVVPRAAVNLG